MTDVIVTADVTADVVTTDTIVNNPTNITIPITIGYNIRNKDIIPVICEITCTKESEGPNRLLFAAALSNDTKTMARAYANGANANNIAILTAAFNGRLAALKYVLRVIKHQSYKKNKISIGDLATIIIHAQMYAAEKGHIHILEYFARKYSMNNFDNVLTKVVMLKSDKQQEETIRWLITQQISEAGRRHAFYAAVIMNNFELVYLLYVCGFASNDILQKSLNLSNDRVIIDLLNSLLEFFKIDELKSPTK